MDKSKETSTEAISADALQKAAADGERVRITGISSVLDGEEFASVRNKAIAEGWSVDKAKAEAFEVLLAANAAERNVMQSQLDESKARLDAIAEGGSEVTGSEASDEDEDHATAAGDDGQVATYEAAVEKFRGLGSTKAKAYVEAAKKYPKAHKAWKESQPGYSTPD